MGLTFERKSRFLGDDLSWLDSREGVATATTVTLDGDAFNGQFVKAGTPVARNGDLAVPYNPSGTDGSQNLYGFVRSGRDTSAGDEPAPVIRNGHIYVPNLPVEFTPVEHNHFTFVS